MCSGHAGDAAPRRARLLGWSDESGPGSSAEAAQHSLAAKHVGVLTSEDLRSALGRSARLADRAEAVGANSSWLCAGAGGQRRHGVAVLRRVSSFRYLKFCRKRLRMPTWRMTPSRGELHNLARGKLCTSPPSMYLDHRLRSLPDRELLFPLLSAALLTSPSIPALLWP